MKVKLKIALSMFLACVNFLFMVVNFKSDHYFAGSFSLLVVLLMMLNIKTIFAVEELQKQEQKLIEALMKDLNKEDEYEK